MHKPHTILLVDDHSEVREPLRWLLDSEPDLQVVGEAGSGQDALKSCEAYTPSLVLLDIKLPDLDGYTVTHALKALERPPRVILMTAYADAITQQRAQIAGGDGFIEKSAGWEALLAQVRAVLQSP